MKKKKICSSFSLPPPFASRGSKKNHPLTTSSSSLQKPVLVGACHQDDHVAIARMQLSFA